MHEHNSHGYVSYVPEPITPEFEHSVMARHTQGLVRPQMNPVPFGVSREGTLQFGGVDPTFESRMRIYKHNLQYAELDARREISEWRDQLFIKGKALNSLSGQLKHTGPIHPRMSKLPLSVGYGPAAVAKILDEKWDEWAV